MYYGKFKRMTSVILAMSLLLFAFPSLPAGASAGENVLTVATEHFSGYGIGAGFPYTAYGNFPAAGASLVDKGNGWSGKWSPSKTDFSAAFQYEVPALLFWDGFSQPVSHSYSGRNLYRQLSAPIAANADGTVYVQFDMMAQYVGRSGAVIGDVFFGVLPNGAGDNIHLGAEYQGSSQTGAQLQVGNAFWYTYKAKLAISAQGTDTLSVKVFEKGAAEPADYAVTLPVDLDPLTPIAYAGFEIGPSSYFGNLSVSRAIDGNLSVGPSVMQLQASEDFESYTIGGQFAEDVYLMNYPTANASNANGGFGWGAKWSPSPSDPSANFTNTVPSLAGFFSNSLYSWSGNPYYRLLEAPLPVASDSNIVIAFDLVTQGLADDVGLNLLGGQLKIGLVKNSAGDANLASVTANGVTVTGRTIPHGNTVYRYVAGITTSTTGSSVIRLKIYSKGETEPDAWDVETSCTLGAEPIRYFGMRGDTQSGGFYLDNIEIQKSRLFTKVGSIGNTVNAYLSFASPVDVASLTTAAITVPGAEGLSVTPVMPGGDTALGAIVSFTPGASMTDTFQMDLNIPQLDAQTVSLTFDLPPIETPAFTISGVSLTREANKITASFIADGVNSKGGNNTLLVLAAYGEADELLGFDLYEKTERQEEITLEADLASGEVSHVKILCWDNWDNMRPLRDFYTE